MPYLSCIQRKPGPLGVEFKVVACPETGMFLYIELQQGKAMRDHMYSKEYGVTAACTMRICEGAKRYKDGIKTNVESNTTNGDPHEVVFGNSWFSSVTTVSAMYRKYHMRYFGVVKTSQNPVLLYHLMMLYR